MVLTKFFPHNAFLKYLILSMACKTGAVGLVGGL